MSTPEKTTAKQAQARFKPGVSGNPAGRPKGARNKASMLAQTLLEEQTEAVVQTVIGAALKGDLAACKLILERLVPPVKETPVDAGALSLPELSAGNLPAAIGEVVQAVADGALLPGQGEKLVSMLQGYAKAVELQELEQRIAALEAQGGER